MSTPNKTLEEMAKGLSTPCTNPRCNPCRMDFKDNLEKLRAVFRLGQEQATATLHELLAACDAVIDPEENPELQERLTAVLSHEDGSCKEHQSQLDSARADGYRAGQERMRERAAHVAETPEGHYHVGMSDLPFYNGIKAAVKIRALEVEDE